MNITTDRKHCFVIMPFSATTKAHTEEYWNNHFENRLKPLIESVEGTEAFRSEPLRQDILRQIIEYLVYSPIVVADLSDSNPNVYWELGVRLSFSHGTITIAEKGTEIPFDVKTRSVLKYSEKDFENKTAFSEQFRKAILDCISNPERPDSIVLGTITGRGSVYMVIRHQELIRRVDGLISENELNRAILKSILEQIYENKGKKLAFLRSHWQRITVNLGCSALDLLLAEHYLEENAAFYEFAHTLLVLIRAINQQVGEWGSSRTSEEWFLKNEYNINMIFPKFQEQLAAIRLKLVESR